MIDRNHKDWRRGFNSALSGWVDIPPAGADKTSWMAGWREGRACGLERRCRRGGIEKSLRVREGS
jgi:hypothetical protein